MWIKICGNTSLHDAQLAVDAGADALGFVFAPSPRRVTSQQVAVITLRLPAAIEKIGVFGSLEFEEIADAVRAANLTGVQLHGGFSPLLVESLREEFAGALRIIQTAHFQTAHGSAASQPLGAFVRELAEYSAVPQIDAVLVDSRTATAIGGTGVAFDWAAAREALGSLENKTPKRLIVAGGLTPENVSQAIRTLPSWGVDVASGVEASPGKKDAAKVKSFIDAARSAQAR